MSVPGYYYPNQAYPSQPIGPDQRLGTDSGLLVESTSVIVWSSTSDTATAGESRSGAISSVRSDTSALTDQSNNLASNTSSDTASLTESQFMFQGLLKDSSELATFTETISLYVTQSRTDTASGNDSQQESASFYKADLYTINDFIAAQNLLVSDSQNFTDSSPIQFNYIIRQDTFTALDLGFSNRPLDASDLFSLNEQCYVNAYQLPTEDPFVYPAYKHSNDLRVIAQDHFTREIIHWDLPVDNVTITFTLSGPNLFSAKITSEMESIRTLDPPLTPDRTWLHVEENQEIIASFIMTPIVEDIPTESRTIEGEGFSAYPHWVYYEGASYVGVQIDPSRMIAKLWEHVQSFPDGNLGVTLKGLGTPVRIGYPPDTSGYHAVTGIDIDQNNGGPYVLNFWSAINCGEEIEKLCKETPIEYYERSYWNAYHTDINHEIIFGYPRVGKKRDDLIFREGENLYQLTPSYQESQDNYASDVLVIGAGTGSASIRAKASARIGRLRRTKVLQNQNIIRNIQAEQIARFELTRLNESRFLIDSVTVDLTHMNTSVGSFIQGDDIYVQCNVPYIGYVQRWYRITSYVYDIYNKVASLSLDPSESFAYGGTNVSPTSYLPIAGFAMVSHQPVYKGDIDAQNPNGYEVIGSIEVTTDIMKVYEANAVYDICAYHNVGAGISPGYAAVTYKSLNGTNIGWKLVPLEQTGDSDLKLVLARTEEGGYFVGDNVFFMDNFGNYFGERPDKTEDLSANPVILSWVVAYANKLIQIWENNPKSIGPGLTFPGHESVPGAIQGIYNNYIFAKAYYGWGGTYSSNGPGPELYGIMKGMAAGIIYIY